MEGLGLEEDALLQKFRDSRHRFQRRMQQLIEKYNQPFEDDPLVHMATLTYQTPQGLKIWGGKLIKEGSKGLIQDPPGGSPEDRAEGPRHAAAQGDTPPPSCTPVLGAGSGSGDASAASDAGSPAARALVPAVPRSPLGSELRRRYLTQVDALLQDAGCFEGADKRAVTGTPRTLEPSLASPATPGPGCSAENPGDPAELAPSPPEWDPLCACPADLVTAPRNDSLSLLGTSSCLSSQSFEAGDDCDVTISELYAGMLHSMSRLLSRTPSSIISTRTFIVQSRSSRRRLARRGRARTSQPPAARRSRRERPAPCSEPRQELGPLGDCENVTRRKPGLKLGKAFLTENQAPSLKLDSGWKELQVTPRKHSLLTSLDLNTVHRPDQEKRLTMLKWLISPVKIVSRARMLPVQAENRYREIKVSFNRLHEECCLGGPPGSGAVDVYRGGSVSPGALGGLETRRWSLPFSRAKAKRLSEAFENLGRRSVEIGRGPPEGHPSPSPKDSPAQSRGRSWQTTGLFQGRSSGTFRRALSPSQTISVPRIEPLDCGRNRYNEIKEKFDQLHQKCCQTSPQGAEAAAHPGMPPAEVQLQELFGTSDRDSLFQKWSPSPQWHMPSPQGSPAHTAGRDSAKRRRLSDPQVCGHWASSQDPSEVGEADPRPGEQGGPAPSGW